jgi:hypothetical protein
MMHGQKINRVQSLSLEHATRTAFCESHGTEIKSDTLIAILRFGIGVVMWDTPAQVSAQGLRPVEHEGASLDAAGYRQG